MYGTEQHESVQRNEIDIVTSVLDTPRIAHVRDTRLVSDKVYVWLVRVEPSSATDDSLTRLLSAEEMQRAERFHFVKDRNLFVVSHAFLRQLLAKELGTAPEHIEFAHQSNGKPVLAEGWSRSGIEFNLSHSGALVALALARGRRVGVDVEKFRSDVDIDDLMESFYSDAEISALRCLSPEERAEAFFRVWTRKEAYVKATGGGLSTSLRSFDVTCSRTTVAGLLATRTDPSEAMRWDLLSLDVSSGYAAALAVERNSN